MPGRNDRGEFSFGILAKSSLHCRTTIGGLVIISMVSCEVSLKGLPYLADYRSSSRTARLSCPNSSTRAVIEAAKQRIPPPHASLSWHKMVGPHRVAVFRTPPRTVLWRNPHGTNKERRDAKNEKNGANKRNGVACAFLIPR